MRPTRRDSRGLLLAISIFLSSFLLIRAQSSTGQIDVTVADASESLVSDARVTVTGAETGAVVRTHRTNELGLAAMPLLPPGTYDVKVEKDGFKSLLRKGVVLRVTEVVSLRLALELGSTIQAVTILGESPLVDTATNAEGQVITDVTMQQLPLNGRNYLQLSILTAGTVPSVNKDQSFSAFGNRGMQNVYLLDGGLNESFIRGIDNHQRDAVRPSLEAIQEFKVQTGNYSAEYGSSAGGVVSVVTKSGTNEIHGAVFNFLRNSAVGARDFFAPPGPVPHLVFNQYGGALGGPIVKNRAWVFGA
ncbi:MAG: carboxypeptidase regulatory-like domain-containing protein [Acidobacteria bacterium]|nr:carboxypeptidase regulatory-like domain-containing protein [Acidobacteriota bacterium]